MLESSRRTFLKEAGCGVAAVITMSALNVKSAGRAAAPGGRMPVLFVGHGHPLNAIQHNPFTVALSRVAADSPRPKAILAISAHWLSYGTLGVSTTAKPETIYDFGDFGPELFKVVYPAPGAPPYAEMVRSTLKPLDVKADSERGLDHGAWTILKHIYPAADVPVFQMSIDFTKPPQYHYDLGRQLGFLRERGVLVIGSGNIVHNLMMLDWDNIDGKTDAWAREFDAAVASRLDKGDHPALVNYLALGKSAAIAVPTNDHYLPMLYTIGMQGKGEPLRYVYEGFQYGNVGMRCFRIG
jgi:4,5-DOPA dioxygenase extradiol